MGQYFRIVNLTKKQYINPLDFDDGPKLMEFGQASSGVLMALAILTANGNGRGGGDLYLRDFSPLISKEMKAYHKAMKVRDKLTPEERLKTPYPTWPDHTPSPHFDIVGSWANNRIVTAGDNGDRGRWVTKAQTEIVIAARIETAKERFRDEGKPWTAEEEATQRSYGADLYDVAGHCYENVSKKVLHVVDLCGEGRSAAKKDHFEFVRGWMTRQIDRDYWAGRFSQVQVSKRKKRPCWDLTDMTGEMLDSIVRTVSDDGPRLRSLIKWLKQQKLPEHIRLLVDCYKPDGADGKERHNFPQIKRIIHEHLGVQNLDQVKRILPDPVILTIAGNASRMLDATMVKLECNREEALLYLANEIAQRAPPTDPTIPTRERSIALEGVPAGGN